MNTLNTFHRQILVGKLKDLFDKKESLRNFQRKLLEDKLEATSEKEQDACQAGIDTNELDIEFVQNQIERIEEILIDNSI